jgi:hypothetical protein
VTAIDGARLKVAGVDLGEVSTAEAVVLGMDEDHTGVLPGADTAGFGAFVVWTPGPDFAVDGAGDLQTVLLADLAAAARAAELGADDNVALPDLCARTALLVALSPR